MNLYTPPMGRAASSFIAGILIGAAITAGIAAVAVRLADLRSPPPPPAPNEAATTGATAPIRARTLRLAHGLNTDHPVHLGLERFSELVRDRSGGKITIQLFPNGELGDETVTIEQLQSGTLDFAKASAAPLGSFSSDFAVFSVPYAFRSADHCWSVLNGPIGQEILGSLSDKGLYGLCYMDAGARSFYAASRPIHRPEDLEGLKVRVMESKTAMDMVSAFGGAPTPMAYSELYSALQSRLVDAAENNPPSFFSSRHYEVATHYTLNEHSRVPDVLIMSDKTRRELSSAALAVIEEAAAEASLYQRELWARRTAEALSAVRELGVEVYKPDLGAFASVVEPLKSSYRGTRIGDLLARIDAVEDLGD